MGQNKWMTLRASSALGAAGEESADQINRDHRGVTLVIDNTDETGTNPTLTVTIEGKSAQGDYYTILTSTALAAQAVTTLTVYPGLTAAANSVANAVLPRIWRAVYAIGGTADETDPENPIAPSVTFSVSAQLHI